MNPEKEPTRWVVPGNGLDGRGGDVRCHPAIHDHDVVQALGKRLQAGDPAGGKARNAGEPGSLECGGKWHQSGHLGAFPVEPVPPGIQSGEQTDECRHRGGHGGPTPGQEVSAVRDLVQMRRENARRRGPGDPVRPQRRDREQNHLPGDRDLVDGRCRP